MNTPRNDDTDPMYELFGPPLRSERKLPCLTLYNPWARMYYFYQLGLAGLMPIRTLGPLNPSDAKDIEQWYREDAA
ncbi:hypothetical protein [Ralstonia pseudosolanacearum]|uniref:Uncharacterized protein n=1 Tax=Ralstonia solanacearum TaxID=305 RepID=A0AA92EC62_RALSL|nr:hypothetical protein [Ralstonia pseudosolanacearum]QCX49359.1 hypothetical protein E7Z57_09730 [Ralstonia pseudosolanacearum]